MLLNVHKGLLSYFKRIFFPFLTQDIYWNIVMLLSMEANGANLQKSTHLS